MVWRGNAACTECPGPCAFGQAPLLDEEFARASKFGGIVTPQSFAVAMDYGHGCHPSCVGKIPGSHLIFAGEEWWFYGTPVYPGDKLPRRVIGPHSRVTFALECRAHRQNIWGTWRWNQPEGVYDPATDDAGFGATSHWTNRARPKADFGAFHEYFDATQHVMTNHLVSAEGNSAAAHTYGGWRLIRHVAGDPPVWDGTGYYDDQLVRTPAGWRIARRICRVVHWTGNPRVQTPIEDVEFRLDLVAPRREAGESRLNFLNVIT